MDYAKVAKTFQELESTQKTLEKTDILAKLYSESNESLPHVVLLTTGTPIPSWKDIDLGISSKTVTKIISVATGHKISEIEEKWTEKGDLGLVAQEMVKNKKQQRLMQEDLTVEKVVKRFEKVAEMEKEGKSESVSQDKKIKEIAELLSSSEPIEARYIVRAAINHLRIGVGTGIIRDALSKAFFDEKYQDEIQRAYDLTNDFTEVAEACINGIEEVKSLEIQLFKPINSMLAKKVETIEDGFKEVGRPAAIDYKYDGMRAQIHVKDGEVRIFTRRLEDVTKQFPDAKKIVKNHIKADNLIIDAEIIGYNPETQELVPFQKLSKRIKRKYEIEKMVNNIPVEVRPFDLIYLEESWVENPYRKRWEKLKELIDPEERKIRLADHEVTEEDKKVQEMQQKSLAEGQEGIMMKSLDAAYKPGSRVGYMVKLKPVMETLDLAIIGGERGEGRRTGWIGSLKLGCWNEEKQEYQEIGKMATGLTDKQLEEITERLEPLIISEQGKSVEVRPDIIVEAEYEEIQKSPSYSSGYALRFPRLKQFREDKEEADTIEKVKSLYQDQ